MAYRPPIVLACVLALAACNPIKFFFGDATESADDAPAPSTSTAAAPLAASRECPAVSGPTRAGQLSPTIEEASGIAASSMNPSVYWVHNDSGDTARAFAVNARGDLLLTVLFDVDKPIDIEDMAIEDGTSGSRLYFADIGDNTSVRKDVVIYRFAEPRLVAGQPPEIAVTSEKMRVRYADGPHDAETLLFDPPTKDLFVVAKLFGIAGVYRIGAFEPGATATATKVASVAMALATSGAVSRDGQRVGLRNYTTKGMLWQRRPNEDLATLLGRPPCTIPIAQARLGEAFAFLADDRGYVTTNEGKGANLDVARFE